MGIKLVTNEPMKREKLNTQGLNDWKSEKEESSTYDAILQVCDESDIIFETKG